MQQILQNQVAIISGGLGDIGLAIARTLAQQGASIALGDLRPAHESADAVSSLQSIGPAVRYDQVDVSDADAVSAWVQAVESSLGRPTLIIPNAAIVTLHPSLEITPQQWTREMRVNVDGAFFMAQACAQRLKSAGQPGRIVFIGSWAGHAPHVHIPAYCASKAALRMLCKTMALELAADRILVNEVAPGYVDAGLTGKVWASDAALREAGRATVPTHDLITPDDVARQVLHLCDPANRHMTGTVLLMDGGLSLTNASTSRKDER